MNPTPSTLVGCEGAKTPAPPPPSLPRALPRPSPRLKTTLASSRSVRFLLIRSFYHALGHVCPLRSHAMLSPIVPVPERSRQACGAVTRSRLSAATAANCNAIGSICTRLSPLSTEFRRPTARAYRDLRAIKLEFIQWNGSGTWTTSAVSGGLKKCCSTCSICGWSTVASHLVHLWPQGVNPSPFEVTKDPPLAPTRVPPVTRRHQNNNTKTTTARGSTTAGSEASTVYASASL